MFEIADLLMKSGKVDLNKVGGDSMKTPLFKSVEENNEEAILFLLRNGADPHTRGYFEPISSVVEAADVSRYYGYTRITRILVDPHKSYMAVVVEAAAAANENVYTLGTGLPGALCSGECTICCDECDEMVPLSECRHVFCVECLRCWFRTLAKQHKPIVCPQEGCGCKCSVYDLRAVLSAEECEEVERRVLVAGLALQPNFVWCPTPGCGSGMFLLEEANGGGGGCTTVTCRDCGKSFCRLCFMDHGEKSCRDKYDEMSSYEWLSTNTKECPNCKARIVKNGGCSHMRCLHCQYEFCWICMNKYTGKYTFGDVDPCRSS